MRTSIGGNYRLKRTGPRSAPGFGFFNFDAPQDGRLVMVEWQSFPNDDAGPTWMPRVGISWARDNACFDIVADALSGCICVPATGRVEVRTWADGDKSDGPGGNGEQMVSAGQSAVDSYADWCATYSLPFGNVAPGARSSIFKIPSFGNVVRLDSTMTGGSRSLILECYSSTSTISSRSFLDEAELLPLGGRAILAAVTNNGLAVDSPIGVFLLRRS